MPSVTIARRFMRFIGTCLISGQEWRTLYGITVPDDPLLGALFDLAEISQGAFQLIFEVL